jgi:hypothetical protein
MKKSKFSEEQIAYVLRQVETRLGRRLLSQVAKIVTPDTMLRWQRQLIARKWTYAKGPYRRPGVLVEIRRLVVQMTVFVMNLASRRVQIVGSTPSPNHLFMRQVGRTLTAADEGVLVGHRVLICDRDRKWSASVRERLSEAEIRVVQTPFQAPNANAYVPAVECVGRIRRHQRLGGLLNYYAREAC